MAKVSLEKDKIKFLLVEGVHPSALENLKRAGDTNIEYHKGALDTETLKRRSATLTLSASVPAPI